MFFDHVICAVDVCVECVCVYALIFPRLLLLPILSPSLSLSSFGHAICNVTKNATPHNTAAEQAPTVEWQEEKFDEGEEEKKIPTGQGRREVW